MINEICAKNYCREDVSLIENYEKAITDTTQTWVCHHRDEIKVLPSGMTVIRSYKDLKENGRYYGCPANELIFLTKSEHNRLHNMHMSEDRRKKMNEAKKGQVPWNKGIPALNKGKTASIFGKAFQEHYGITSCDNKKLYHKEYSFYKRHSKFSWEV